MNSNPIQIDLFQITNSLIFKNRLEFLNINETAEYDMRLERLDLLRLSVAYEEITLNMVNKHVFKHMKYLHLFGIIEFIEIELFAHFKKIKYISISPQNFIQFMHRCLEWTNHLNKDLMANMSSLTENKAKIITLEFYEEVDDLKQPYSYPNEDICLFKTFPHKRLIIPIIILGKLEAECSCSLIWLLQYSTYFINTNTNKFE